MVILMTKITYIFTTGRINRINNNKYADEFFYGARLFDKTSLKVEIIEFQNLNKLLKKIEHIISRIFSLPLYVFSILNFKNIKTIKESDYVYLISESSGFAALPILMFVKKKYNVKTNIFIMGLYSKKLNFRFLKFIHLFLIKFLLRYIDEMYFLGKSELDVAKKIHGNNRKLMYKPFYIDFLFWYNKDFSLIKNNRILFVGNDGNRDFNLALRIVKQLPQFNFTFLTSNSEVINFKASNLEVIYGNWGTSNISDLQLKDIYSKSRLIIIPLKESNQPSGQSVTLQAMSVGVPVLISKTKGFWDYTSFINNESILFMEKEIESWVNAINKLFFDTVLLNKISNNARNIVLANYDIKLFYNFLMDKHKIES